MGAVTAVGSRFRGLRCPRTLRAAQLVWRAAARADRRALGADVRREMSPSEGSAKRGELCPLEPLDTLATESSAEYSSVEYTNDGCRSSSSSSSIKLSDEVSCDSGGSHRNAVSMIGIWTRLAPPLVGTAVRKARGGREKDTVPMMA